MPITQSRLAALLAEYEHLAAILADNLPAIESAIHNGLTGESLLAATDIFFHAIRAAPNAQRILERERLNTRWRRNERLRAKAERKRRAAGITARPDKADIPHASPDADFEAEYAAFNRAGAGAREG